MGKSMSTAKQVNRNAITQVVQDTKVLPKSNQQIVPKAAPLPFTPDADYLKKVNTFDKSFNDRLKQVFVTSKNDNPDMNFPKNHAMPIERNTPYSRMPHTQRTEERKPNMLFVDEIKTMLGNHKSDPKKWTLDYIVEKYDISKENAEKLVKYYSCLHTFYSSRPSESDKYLQREEPVRKPKGNTPVLEMEDMITAGQEKKWKTKEDFEKEWKHLPW
ncbi:uncharacterized protein LOC116343192 [Contarinia nasturtii]|uniref:uncharacterized protein LOC116343192 n=1 Tax=Contarinia nasturtii TaxID=265458 RepID=UPI0012D3DFB8|nr:uncharacterized protein LOC116343192 [Contarinia nasturtii]